ncbi:MAG: DUF6090 family protein [Bacteroidetes bacterium]|nr:DUF6090 family protein [Bacteroidota bacterium]
MIKFFRKIRQRMLTENKFSKYLIYAIGEIILVIIGILIALQVNNWNENRKSRNIQNNLLAKLITDLNADIDRFNEIDSIYQSDLKEILYVTEEALSGKNSRLNSPNQMVAGRGSAQYLTLSESTFQEMINTGKLYQISDEQLKNDIIAYYELSTFLLEKENRDNQNLNNWLLGVKDNDMKKIVMRLREQRNLDTIDWSWLQNPNSEMYKEIETATFWLKAAIFANQDVMSEIKSEANKLIITIKNHLED